MSWQIILGLCFDLIGAVLLVGIESKWLQRGLFTIDKKTRQVIQGRNKIEDGMMLTDNDPEFKPLISALKIDNFRNDTGQEDLKVVTEAIEKGDSEVIGNAPYIVTLSIEIGRDTSNNKKKFSKRIVEDFLESRVQSRFTRAGASCLLIGFSIQLLTMIWSLLA